MLSDDLEARLWLDPGQRTLGQLLQDRTAAALEIKRLRHELVKAQEWRRVATNRRPPPGDGKAHPQPLPALLRITEACQLVGMSPSTIYRRIKDGTFPAPLRVGDKSVRWARNAIDAWRDALQPTKAFAVSREKY